MQTAPAESQEPITQPIAASSLGERLIPLLLLLGETCAGYAILLGLAISLGFVGDPYPLIPFWGLLLVLVVFYSLTRLFRRWSQMWIRAILEPSLWVLLSVIFALYFAWTNNYASHFSLFSPTWLLQMLHTFIPVSIAADDTTQVNILPALQAVVLLFLAGFYCWRGYRMAHKHVVTEDIDGLFKWGTVVLLIVVIIFVSLFSAHATLLSPANLAWTCATFFICVPIARALAHASYMRHFHHAGLWGRVTDQESGIWFALSILGLLTIFLVATLLTIFLGDWTLSLPSLPWLNLHWAKPTPGKGLSGFGKGKGHTLSPHIIPTSPGYANWFLFFLGVVPILLIAGLLFWLRYRDLLRATSLAKKKQKVAKDSDEVRESLFKWSLFLEQLKVLFLGLLASLLRKKHTNQNAEQRAIDDILLAEPAVRSIRAIYRALLKQAANMGHIREKDETPYEFRQRLHAAEPSIAPELELITEAYVQVRYSGNQPGESDVSRVRTRWVALRDKWVSETLPHQAK